MESSDHPLSAHVIRGTPFGGDFGGMKFLTRESLLRTHLAMVFRALGVAEAQQEDLLNRLPEKMNGLDQFELLSEGQHGFDRDRVRVAIEKFRGEMGACLGDPCRFIEERVNHSNGLRSERQNGGGWCSR